MNKLTLAVSGLFLCTVYCPAEMLDSVTFNPARLGQYERLKVSDDLTSPGGVEARSLSVRSNGAVSVNNAGNYKIPQAEVKGSLDMTSTEFKTPIVDSRGGTASFERTNPNISSHIEQLTGNVLKAKANVLRAQEISVLGSRSTDYEDNQIQGLKLGGNDIPNREGCSGLNWYARTAGDGNTYKVLGMGSCTGGEEKGFYGPDIYADQFTSDTCPDGDEETRSQTRFSCEANPSYKGKCVDLFNSYFYFTYEDTSATTDTCNGDTVNMFTKTMTQAEKYHKFSCVDVYKQTSSSAGEGVKSTMWQCNGNYVKYDGAVVNGPDAVEIECPCKYASASVKCLVKWHRTDMCIHSGQNKPECYGASTTFTNGTIGPDSSDSLICAQCKGDCERVLVLDQIPGCPAPGLFNCPSAPSRWPVSYRWVNCKNTKARKVIYKRRIGYRKVDCSGGGDVEGAAPEDKGA